MGTLDRKLPWYYLRCAGLGCPEKSFDLYPWRGLHLCFECWMIVTHDEREREKRRPREVFILINTPTKSV